ncbi:MAG: SRPBCC family protein [Myxococcota bacterium]
MTIPNHAELPLPRRAELIAPPGDPSFTIRRGFAAPRALVWEALTRPAYMKEWWGPRVLELVVCEIDLRVGGRYRFVERAPDGSEFAFSGEYRDIRAPERVECTFVFEPMPEHVAVQTMVLSEVPGGTLLTSTTRHSSVEARDGHLASGMEGGMNESYEQLDELLATLVR